MVVIMRDEAKTGNSYGGESPRDFQVEISLKVQDTLLKKVFIFDTDDKIWYAKIQVINELAKGVKDVFNYGFYELPYNGRSGKFMDEERTFRDYPQRTLHAQLEFKYKRRVYKSMQYDAKTLQKVHTKSNLRKLLDCVSSNNISQVSKWTDKGLDPNFQDEKTGETPLSIAVTGDDRRELIATLVNGGAHLDYRAGDGLTPMHKAAIAGKANNVKVLLDLGNSPNIKDPKGLTPLYYTVLRGGDPNCCELLLNEHAEMGVMDHQGMKEIHHACKKGLVQHLEHLIFYGADIDVVTASGNTALHITAISNQEECARVLLFRGAERNKLNYANQSVYEVAAVAGNKDLAVFIRTFTDGQIVKCTEKPTYSTRRRKSVHKPRASSLFVRSPSDAHSNKSDSPRSSGSHRSSTADTISLEENGPVNGQVQRSMSLSSTASDSSYCSEPESLDLHVNEHRSRAKKNRSRDGGKRAPPVKLVSGAATIRKRLYASSPGSRYIAVRDYMPCSGGELQVERGDIVEVFYVGERGFWEGRIDNRTGWFPSSCVEELKQGDKARPKTMFGRPASLSAMFARNEHEQAPPLPDHRFIQPARVVTLNRGKAGFGFQMRGANCQTPRLNFKPSKEFPALQYIGDVEPGGEADRKAVKNDDFIIEVNGEDVTTATHGHVVNLIKRSGKAVKLKVVTVPTHHMNGMDTVDYGIGAGRLGYRSLRDNNRIPPPLPQRDPSTTLTLGRMRTSSRPSLFDSGLAYSQEEPASFQVDSVIAVSKDTQWNTLQRRKPGASNSRSAAQFKFNGNIKGKSRNTAKPIALDQRSHSMHNIAATPTSYDTMTGTRRPVSTAVPFAIPSIPDRFLRSMSYDAESLPRELEHHSHSDPNLELRTLSARSMSVNEPLGTARFLSVNDSRDHTRSMSMNDPRDQIQSMSMNDPRDHTRSMLVGDPRDPNNYRGDASTTNFNEGIIADEDVTIVATPISATVNATEGSGASAIVTAVNDTNTNGNQTNNEDTHRRERKHSLDAKTSEPFNLSNALQKAVEARNERVNEHVSSNSRKVSAPASVMVRKRASTADKMRSDIMSQLNDAELDLDENEPVAGNAFAGSPGKTHSYHGNKAVNQNSIDKHKNFKEHSPKKASPKKASPKKALKPAPSVPKPVVPPPAPPPIPPMVLAPKQGKPVKQVKGKKVDAPLTAVQQGLITVGALQAKRGRLKAVQNTNKETPKSSTSIPDLVGALARHSGKSGGKMPAPFGGNQHANLLAKAVAARAARLATEAQESAEQSDSPSSWEDESSSPNIPFNVNPQKSPVTPKKIPPPVLPKKRSPTPGHRPFVPPKPDLDYTSPRRKLYPPRITDYNMDRPSLAEMYPSEEDRTMMLFDDIIRKEVESESWSLNSWNSSDSAADMVAPPPSFLGCNEERQRKSSTGSSTRAWYEYSSGSPSEESLNASTERIAQLRTSVSQESSSTEGNVESERTPDSHRRRFSYENGRPLISSDDKYEQATPREDIQLMPIDKRHQQPVSSSLKGTVNRNEPNAIDNCSHANGTTIDNIEQNRNQIVQKSEELNSARDEKASPDGVTSTSSTTQGNELVERIITTSTGAKIKILLQPNANKPDQPLTPPTNNNNNTITHTNDQVTEGHFIPPPPVDFDGQIMNEMSSPPLPPPPEFCPVGEDSFSPLPAPPMDFCDNEPDQVSSADPPSVLSKPETGSSFEKKPMLEWTCDDVCDWLDYLKLPQYKNTFRENDIQGLHLPELTKVDLQELGIKSLGHRMTMENSVAKLCHPVESSC